MAGNIFVGITFLFSFCCLAKAFYGIYEINRFIKKTNEERIEALRNETKR